MEKEANKKECPERPGCFMFVTFCAKCKERQGCGAWRKR